MKVLYYCEKCGKPVYNKFGSGRFCSRECANSREMTDERRLNISKGLAKETKCECQYCGKKFSTLQSKASHENLCNRNPNSKSPVRNTKDKSKMYKMKTGEELDVSYQFIEDYKQKQTVCEICGKTINEVVKWKSIYAPKNLCVDHDHITGKFRGLLCSVCNRQLGWYEENKDSIESYLLKKL